MHPRQSTNPTVHMRELWKALCVMRITYIQFPLDSLGLRAYYFVSENLSQVIINDK